MKKMFFVLLALVAASAVFAQSSRSEGRDVILGRDNSQNRTVYDRDYDRSRSNDRYDNNSERQLQLRVDRISRDYDRRIDAVKRDRYLSNSQRKRQVKILEKERDARIREVRSEYYDRSYSRNNRRY